MEKIYWYGVRFQAGWEFKKYLMIANIQGEILFDFKIKI